jgi:hypothetical protein
MLRLTHGAGLTPPSMKSYAVNPLTNFTANIDFFNQAEKQEIFPSVIRLINGQELIYLLH